MALFDAVMLLERNERVRPQEIENCRDRRRWKVTFPASATSAECRGRLSVISFQRVRLFRPAHSRSARDILRGKYTTELRTTRGGYVETPYATGVLWVGAIGVNGFAVSYSDFARGGSAAPMPIDNRKGLRRNSLLGKSSSIHYAPRLMTLHLNQSQAPPRSTHWEP